jgi:hypothetical protein
MIERQEIEWRPVGDGLPDDGELVLVYDGTLDDVFFGWRGPDPVTGNDDTAVWISERDGYRILDPVCWAHIPYPEQLRRPA